MCVRHNNHHAAGAGVGSSEATPLAAALIWITRDGIGMIGSLMFAYFFADSFEVDMKEWRLFADVLNNIGLSLDLLASVVPSQYYFCIVSLSTLSKACCGLVAGATKARVSAHFAHTGHLADVTAKESTQETGIALIGLVLGMCFARVLGNDPVCTWVLFVMLLVMHQYANYRLVRVLILDSLNPQRIYLITRLQLQWLLSGVTSSSSSTTTTPSSITSTPTPTPTPQAVAVEESVLRPLLMLFTVPRVGVSLEELLSVGKLVFNSTGCNDNHSIDRDNNSNNNSNGLVGNTGSSLSSTEELIKALQSVWGNQQFLLGFNGDNRVVVCMDEECSADNLVKAHFLAHFLEIRYTQQQEQEQQQSSFLGHLSSHVLVSLCLTLGKNIWNRVSYFFIPNHFSRKCEILARYQKLFATDAIDALKWYESSIVGKLELEGWDANENSARLGGYDWRYNLKKSL